MTEQLLTWFNTLPVNQLFGLQCVQLHGDGAVVEVAVRDNHRNPDGSVSGAILSGAADLAAGVAVTAVNQNYDSATGNLNMHFLAPAKKSPLRIEVEILHRGRRTCVPQVRIYDATGRFCTIATGTWLLRDTQVDYQKLRHTD